MKKSERIFSIRKIKNQKKWTEEEDNLLISLVHEYEEKHWKDISKRFARKSPLQCFSRYRRIRPGIVKGSWNKHEDLQIIELVDRYGRSWSKISKIMGTRNGKQIRDRYLNVLDPSANKGKFSEEEDLRLVELFKRYGHRWALISKQFRNRTPDMLKNRFYSTIKRKYFPNDGEIATKAIAKANANVYEYNKDSRKDSYLSNYINLDSRTGIYSTDENINIKEDLFMQLSNVHSDCSEYVSVNRLMSVNDIEAINNFDELLNTNNELRLDLLVNKSPHNVCSFDDYFLL